MGALFTYFKLQFPEIKRITVRNRGKARYLIVKLRQPYDGGYGYLLGVKEGLRSRFPSIYTTSGCNSEMTFRING